MKILKFFFALALFFACETTEDVKVPVSPPEVDTFNSIFTESLNFAKDLTILSSSSSSTGEVLTLKMEIQDLSRSISDHLFSNYFESNQLAAMEVYPPPPASLVLSGSSPIHTVTTLIDTVSLFSAAQRDLMISLTRDIFSLPSLNDGYAHVSDFIQRVTASSMLNEQEKIQMMEFSSSAHSFIKFMEEDGFSSIQASLADLLELPAAARTMCTVDWRDVWAGAVVGFVAGAVQGAYVGVTAGTAIFPVVGSVTGAVSAAVVGGAIGFLTGTVTGIAANLVISCFRSTLSGGLEVSCAQTWEYYLNGWVQSIPENCYSYIISDIKCCN